MQGAVRAGCIRAHDGTGRAEARLGFKAHQHMLRHTCGYVLANRGHDTRALQAYLGHRNGPLGHQAIERFHGLTVREDMLRQRAFVGAQVIAQNAFHYCTQIGSGLEVATLIERNVRNTRPIGNHAPAFERTTR
jgi:hypothetical protein